LLNAKQIKFLTELMEAYIDIIFEKTAKYREYEQIKTSHL